MLDAVLSFLKNIGPWVAAINALLIAAVGFFAMVPGEQPEKFLQSIVDFLTRISKK